MKLDEFIIVWVLFVLVVIALLTLNEESCRIENKIDNHINSSTNAVTTVVK